MVVAQDNTVLGGGGGEKPTLLWSNDSGTNANITVNHSNYNYLIFVCGYSSSSWPMTKKTTLCDKTQSIHNLAIATSNVTTGFSYMSAQIQTGTISFPKKENSYCMCYAVYGCNSLSIDYSEIWARGDIA